MRVVVVGGGISGLAAAWALADRADVLVLEASPQVGGKSPWRAPPGWPTRSSRR